jgi:hypothetical protein
MRQGVFPSQVRLTGRVPVGGANLNCVIIRRLPDKLVLGGVLIENALG